MNRKYLLKAGVLIWIGTDCYSNYNLTDEVAKKYLAMHPEVKEKEFQRWPDENDEEQNAEKLQAANETLKESEKSLALEDVGPRLKEESVADIIAHQDTLKEAIEGGDIISIVAAEEGLKEAWKHAEAKPEEPIQAPEPKDGEVHDPEPKKPKAKKGK